MSAATKAKTGTKGSGVPNGNARKTVVRAVLGVAYAAVLVLMLVTGRQHTVLIDNADAPDGSFAAVDGMAVQVNRLESAEYYPGDRDKAMVKGQKHRIKVEIFNEGKVEERAFRVPFGQDMVILSVPKMLAGIDPWIEPFSVRQAQPEDSGGNQSMQFGGDAVPPAEGLPAEGMPADGVPAEAGAPAPAP